MTGASCWLYYRNTNIRCVILQKSAVKKKPATFCYLIKSLLSVLQKGCGLAGKTEIPLSGSVSYTSIPHASSCVSKRKGKTIQLQAWTGPEGSRMLRLPDFKTIGTRRW